MPKNNITQLVSKRIRYDTVKLKTSSIYTTEELFNYFLRVLSF